MTKRPRSASSLPPQEEPLSQTVLPVPGRAVLLVYRPSADRDALAGALLRVGLQPIFAASIDQAPPAGTAPYHCLLEWAQPGVPDYMRALNTNPHGLWPVAIVESREESAQAYAAGAVATLGRPLILDEVAACLLGLRARREQQLSSVAASEHSQRASTATAFEAVLRAVGQELRIPVATALANVEYLVEVAQSPGSPLSDEEQLAITTDTLEAMQRVRSALEGLSVIVQRESPTLEPVRLWRVAQRVIDELPNGACLVELVGDNALRGWGDEASLVEVVSILVRRAIARQCEVPDARVHLHIYAHDTEARLTVREPSRKDTRRRTSDDPFTLGRSTPTGAQSGLELVAARHAIVRLGGRLTYVAQKEAGCAFRVRLKLVLPSTT